jgi:catechol 2,3-dioxygenase-like lactoylglutathione lyase family enzyme
MVEAGIPTLRGSEHIGLAVPDIEQATAFFVDVIGGEVLFELGPVSSDNDSMLRLNRFHPRTIIRKLRVIKIRNGPALEVFQFEAPDQRRDHPRNTDAGGHHIAFYVDDIDKATAYLKDRGVEVFDGPNLIADGPSAGLHWLYFLAPWGLQLELVSYPRGLAYEKASDAILWDPRK